MPIKITTSRSVTELMDWIAANYGRTYAPNTRETIRRFTLHQFIERIVRVGYPFDSGSHKMLWSRESIYQEANPEVTALARRGAA